MKMGTSFEYSKTLALEGSILLILGIVPYVGWVLGIIGIILFLRGIKELANYYQDNQIYQNSLTGIKFYIIALVALAVAGAGFVVAFVPTAGFTLAVNSINIVRTSSWHHISDCCLRVLRPCSHAPQKNL